MLNELRHQSDRRAHFTTVMVMAWPDGHTEVAEGIIAGTILPAPRGTQGFGYDPIFLPDGYALSYAEMNLEDKILLSHRTRAMCAMIAQCLAR